MTTLVRASLLFLAVAALFNPSVPSLTTQVSAQTAKPIVFMLSKNNGKLSYSVESKLVKDPLRGLGEQVEQKGENYPVVIFFTPDVTFEEENDIELIANKAGFKNVRSFARSRDPEFMQELKWGPVHPFSTNPPAN